VGLVEAVARAGAFTFAFVCLTLASFAFKSETARLATVFAGVAFLTGLTGVLVVLTTGFFAAVAFAAFADFAAFAVFTAFDDFVITNGFDTTDGFVTTFFVLAALWVDDLGEVVLGVGIERNFAFARTVVFAVFAVAFAIIVGRFESVSLIRIPFYKK
jgi:hypothetical protein